MKIIAVASVLVLSLGAASAFAPRKLSSVHQPTQLKMASPAEFVNTEIGAHDVSPSTTSRKNFQ